MVLVVVPEGQLATGIGQAVEDLFVEALVAQAAVERLDIAILLGLSWVDVVPFDTVLIGPFEEAFEVNSVPLSETMQAGSP